MASSEGPQQPQERVHTHLTEIARGPQMEWPDEDVPRMPLTKGWLPLVAVALVMLGGFFGVLILPLVLLGVGLGLLWRSPLWIRREQIVASAAATGLVLFLPVGVLVATDNALAAAAVLTALIIAMAALIWVLVQGGRRVSGFDQRRTAG
ncbi:MAG: hypothetical protein ACK5KU_08040 [Beutenbergiaceae bacterium]